MPQWTQVYFLAFWPLLLAICVAGFVWGDRPVRSTATSMLIAMMAASPLFSSIEFRQVEIRLASIDFLLLIALTWFSVRWQRWWLIMIASLQILMVLGHFSKMIWPSMSRLTYAITTGGAAYLQLTLLSIGVLLAIRSRQLRTHRPACN